MFLYESMCVCVCDRQSVFEYIFCEQICICLRIPSVFYCDLITIFCIYLCMFTRVQALAIGAFEWLVLVAVQFDASGFALVSLYLLLGVALSFLIQSPVWSSLVLEYLRKNRCTAAVRLLRLALQSVNVRCTVGECL
jgi:hypothetical protein